MPPFFPSRLLRNLFLSFLVFPFGEYFFHQLRRRKNEQILSLSASAGSEAPWSVSIPGPPFRRPPDQCHPPSAGPWRGPAPEIENCIEWGGNELAARGARFVQFLFVPVRRDPAEWFSGEVQVSLPALVVPLSVSARFFGPLSRAGSRSLPRKMPGNLEPCCHQSVIRNPRPRFNIE